MIGLVGIGGDFVFWDNMYEWNWMVLQPSVVEIETDKHSVCLEDYREPHSDLFVRLLRRGDNLLDSSHDGDPGFNSWCASLCAANFCSLFSMVDDILGGMLASGSRRESKSDCGTSSS